MRAYHGGARKRPEIIDEIHDQWCRDNGYPVLKPTSPQAKLRRKLSHKLRLKRDPRINELPNLGTGVESKVPKLQGTSYQYKSIFFMLKMKRNLVRREPHRFGIFGRNCF